MRRVRKSLTGIAFIALSVTAVIPGMAEPAASATAAAGAAAAAGATAVAGARAAAVRASLRSELNHYLNGYRVAEHISAVSLAVTFRGRRPGIDLAAGSTRYYGGHAISPHALWQIGSNTKAFTSVLLLQLEAEHKLSINDTLGKWLPRYPAWRGVTIKRLLNMTSGIPSYTDSPEFWHDVAAAPHGVFSASRLVSYALGLPATHGYSYSNTNYILAQMIIERATHDSYGRPLRRRIAHPLSLHNLFYSGTGYRRAITARMPAGYWSVAALPEMASQLGHDQSRHTLSWAKGAGGIVSSLQDLATWDRALYTGRELPGKQQRELMSLVSARTGKPITKTSLSDPAGYGLGISQVTSKTLGTVWYYEGETTGFRVVNIFVPRSGTVIAIGVNSATLSDHTAALATSVYQTLRKAGLS
jgi:D-alanyl-D-alanine carboxypeptidase